MSAVCAIVAIATKNTMIDVSIFFISFCSLVQDSVYGLHKPVELFRYRHCLCMLFLPVPILCFENRLPIVLKIFMVGKSLPAICFLILIRGIYLRYNPVGSL